MIPAGAGGYPNRRRLHTELDRIRQFHNRITHHEPIWRGNHKETMVLIMQVVRHMSANGLSLMWLADWSVWRGARGEFLDH